MNQQDVNLEERYASLPNKIKEILTSTEVIEDVREIGNDNNLNLDQQSVLFDMTADILFGILPSKSFVSAFAKEADVEESVAQNVANEVSDKIFSSIRSDLQALELDGNNVLHRENSISSIEKAGGFEIERHDTTPDGTSVPRYGTEAISMKGVNVLGTESSNNARERWVPQNTAKVPQFNSNIPSMSEGKSAAPSKPEPLVEQLMKAGAVVPQSKTVIGNQQKPQNPPQNPPRGGGNDPYRESFK